jgi:outer membrane lipoprotein SlyB
VLEILQKLTKNKDKKIKESTKTMKTINKITTIGLIAVALTFQGCANNSNNVMPMTYKTNISNKKVETKKDNSSILGKIAKAPLYVVGFAGFLATKGLVYGTTYTVGTVGKGIKKGVNELKDLANNLSNDSTSVETN